MTFLPPPSKFQLPLPSPHTDTLVLTLACGGCLTMCLLTLLMLVWQDCRRRNDDETCRYDDRSQILEFLEKKKIIKNPSKKKRVLSLPLETCLIFSPRLPVSTSSLLPSHLVYASLTALRTRR